MRGGRLLVIRDLIGELGEIEGTKFLAIGIQATICIPYVRAGKLAAMMAVHDDDRPGAERAFLHANDSQSACETDFRLRRADGL